MYLGSAGLTSTSIIFVTFSPSITPGTDCVQVSFPVFSISCHAPFNASIAGPEPSVESAARFDSSNSRLPIRTSRPVLFDLDTISLLVFAVFCCFPIIVRCSSCFGTLPVHVASSLSANPGISNRIAGDPGMVLLRLGKVFVARTRRRRCAGRLHVETVFRVVELERHRLVVE